MTHSRLGITRYPVNAQCATLILVHGMAEHGKRYEPFIEFLNNNQIACITVDLPGHGTAIGTHPKGHFTNLNGLLHELDQLMHETQHPRFILGHSMGSLVVRAYINAYRTTLDGIILSGSPYKPDALPLLRAFTRTLQIGRKQKPSKFLDSLVNGTLSKSLDNPKTPFDWLSVDKDNISRYIADPLCGFPLTYEGYVTFMDLFHDVYNKQYTSSKNNTPVYFIAGGNDPCPNYPKDGLTKAIKRLTALGYTSIDSKIYPQSYHEILNDIEKDSVYADVLSFILKNKGA